MVAGAAAAMVVIVADIDAMTRELAPQVVMGATAAGIVGTGILKQRRGIAVAGVANTTRTGASRLKSMIGGGRGDGHATVTQTLNLAIQTGNVIVEKGNVTVILTQSCATGIVETDAIVEIVNTAIEATQVIPDNRISTTRAMKIGGIGLKPKSAPVSIGHAWKMSQLVCSHSISGTCMSMIVITIVNVIANATKTGTVTAIVSAHVVNASSGVVVAHNGVEGAIGSDRRPR